MTVICLSLVIFAFACAQADETPKLLASIKPIELIVQAITRETPIETQSLLPANASPHQYSLRPSDIRKIKQADLLIWLGSDYEPYLSNVAGEQMALLALLEPNKLVRTKGEHGSKHKHEHHHQHGELDPHFWLDPELALDAAELMTQKLAKKYPLYAEQFSQNLKIFKNDVKTMDEELREKILNYRNTPFLVYHRGYDYLFRHYGLKGEKGVIQEQVGVGLSLKKLNQLDQTIGAHSKICLFNEVQFAGSPMPAFLKNESTEEKRIIQGELDPLGAAALRYEDVLKNLLNQMVSCFLVSDR